MIALSMVVRHEVANRVLERGLFEGDHSAQAALHAVLTKPATFFKKS
jgi:hypothetical protein